jgi:hypothetical protein
MDPAAISARPPTTTSMLLVAAPARPAASAKGVVRAVRHAEDEVADGVAA